MTAPIFVFDKSVVFSTVIESESNHLEMVLPSHGMHNEMGWMCPIGVPSMSIVEALRRGNMDNIVKPGGVLHINAAAEVRLWMCQFVLQEEEKDSLSLLPVLLPYCDGFRYNYSLYKEISSTSRLVLEAAKTPEEIPQMYNKICAYSNNRFEVHTVESIAEEVRKRNATAKPRLTELVRLRNRNTPRILKVKVEK